MNNSSNKISHTEKKLTGLVISKGCSFGKICLFNDSRHENSPVYKINTHEIEQEINRFAHSVDIASEKLEELITNIKTKIGLAEAEIFSAQKMLILDPTIQKKVIEEIEANQTNAEAAITKTLDFFEAKILDIDDDYIKERATDIGEVKRRLLDVLANLKPTFKCEGQKHCRRGKNRIIASRELTPSLTIELDTDTTLGFVTEKGGYASHAAILARSLRIPAVSGIKDLYNNLLCGTEILIDGDKGEVIIWPSSETLELYPNLKTQREQDYSSIDPIKDFKVMANLSLSKDIDLVNYFKAEGIGLYRTEFEFLSRGKLLSEHEQFEIYSHVIKKMEGKPVYFRLLDIGGDKSAPFFNLPKEENPYLGFRGARLLAQRPDLFKAQARALAKASQFGKTHILYPMIIEKSQFIQLKKMFLDFTTDIDTSNVFHGVMFEVPSACFQANEIFEIADFASIGTNDLIQYLFAVDRNNELVAKDYNPDREIFWNVLKIIVDAANKFNKPLSLCGEISNDSKYILKLYAIGIKTISASPKLIPEIRKHIKSIINNIKL
ncbi:MAG: hypothetical protein ACD_79C01098G0003 [uncultured bacterium]|nr:MAG: hypothetical protein ACD_79C01098G0003 [uncultured bacterium]